MVRRRAVLECMRAAGILGDVAADRAGLLARGIGGVEEAELRDRRRELGVHDPGLHDRDPVLGVDLEDPVHAGAFDEDRALRRVGAAREARSRRRGARNGSRTRGTRGRSRATCAVVSGSTTASGALRRERQPVALVGEELALASRGSSRRPRSGADGPGRARTSGEAEAFQVVLVEAEVVADLVSHGDLDLLDQLFLVLADLLEVLLEQQDPVEIDGLIRDEDLGPRNAEEECPGSGARCAPRERAPGAAGPRRSR